MTFSFSKKLPVAGALLSTLVLVVACGDSDGVSGTDTTDTTDTTETTETTEAIDTSSSGDSESDTNTDSASAPDSCETIAAAFQTNGSANTDLPEPEVSALCVDDNVVVSANGIPDFPYIITSPGLPNATDSEYTLPATPLIAEETSAIPALGAIGVAVNGIPIFGATEGTGGDVFSLAGGFTECGGHNGPTGYHYHTFDTTGSDVCRFSESEAIAESQLFGYAFDGFPIYSGNYQYTSSWTLTDPSLFATDTFSAHTYTEGAGDLDQCNGRFDEAGNYAYYTTEEFPYTLGCYTGVVEAATAPPGGPRSSDATANTQP